MRITLLVTSFNALSQAVYLQLRDDAHEVDVVYATSLTRDEEIAAFHPDLILCPFLRHYIPASIYERYATFVFHPGIKGDRGAYSLEWALWKEKASWGGVWLKATKELDGGDILLQEQFEVGQNESISSLMVKSSLLAESLLQTLLNDLETIYESATPQQKRLATYWKQPSIERRIMSWLNDTQQFRQAIRQYGHFGILITIYEELFIVSQLEVADFKHDYKLGSIIFEDQALISVAMNGGFAVVFKSSMVLVNSAVLE